MWRLEQQVLSLVGYQNPSIWLLIKTLHKEENSVSVVISRNAIGEPPKKKKNYVDLQQRLRNLYKDYNEGRKDLCQFLRALGHNIQINSMTEYIKEFQLFIMNNTNLFFWNIFLINIKKSFTMNTTCFTIDKYFSNKL